MPQDILPLESPPHSWAREPGEVRMHMPALRRSGPKAGQPARGSSYPPPVTVTSPPTPLGGRPVPLPNLYCSTTPSPLKSQQRAQSYAGPGANAGGVPMYPGMPQPQAQAGAIYHGQLGLGLSNYATRPPPAVPSKDYTRASPPVPSTANSPSRMPKEAEDGKLRKVFCLKK
ncbi:hypothetical protein FRC08_013107 [Ceratobasidium sp. 394]|nr:hypothetical protein FRC08_013107 [Ceratobasidium sp. 394]